MKRRTVEMREIVVHVGGDPRAASIQPATRASGWTAPTWGASTVRGYAARLSEPTVEALCPTTK